MDIFANGYMLNYRKGKYYILMSGYFSFELFGGVAFKIFCCYEKSIKNHQNTNERLTPKKVFSVILILTDIYFELFGVIALKICYTKVPKYYQN